MFNKRLVSRIYKNKGEAEDLNIHFTKKDILITNNHRKRCATQAVIIEILLHIYYTG